MTNEELGKQINSLSPAAREAVLQLLELFIKDKEEKDA